MQSRKKLLTISSVVAAGAATAALGLASIGSASAAPRSAGQFGPAAADQAAIRFIGQHYPGTGAARVLATEPDTERGQAVYDVRVLAPDHLTYVAHVSRAAGTVLWISKAESQAVGRSAAPSVTADRSPDRADQVDQGVSKDQSVSRTQQDR